MPQYIQLPNGAYFEVKEGERPEDALVAAASRHPEAFQKAAPPPEPPKEQGSYMGDLGRSFASGAVGATGALTSVFGADNAASRYLAEKGESLQKGLSTSRQAELQAQAARMKKAEESGSTWEEVKAGLLNVIEAPLQTTASALGSFAPMVATLPLAKLNLGARAIMAVRGAIGGAQGAGAVKQNVYEAVLEAERADGKSPEQAQAAAARAQSYVGENLDQILLGGGLGVAAGSTGAERLLPGGVRAQAGAAQQALTKKLGERGATAVTAAAGEMPLEALQGGQERLAANLALQRTGRDVDTFAGVAGQATQEALAGGLGGAAVGVALPDRSMSIAARKAEEERVAAEQAKKAEYEASDEFALSVDTQLNQVTQQLAALQQQKRKIEKGSETAEEDREFNRGIEAQIRDVRENAGFDALKEQHAALKPRIEKIKRMATVSPEDALAESIGMPSTPTRDPRTGAPRSRTPLSGQALPEGVDATAFPSAPLAPEERTPFYVEQQTRLATQRAKQAVIEANPELAMAGIDASEGVVPSGDQLIDALAEDPGQAMAVVRTKGALPGMSAAQSNLIRTGLRSRLEQIGSEIGAARQQADARRAEVEQEIQALREMRARADGSDVARMRQMTLRERELQVELDEIKKLARMDPGASQPSLFGEGAGRRVISGIEVDPGEPVAVQRRQLRRALDNARSTGNESEAARIREALNSLAEGQTEQGFDGDAERSDVELLQQALSGMARTDTGDYDLEGETQSTAPEPTRQERTIAADALSELITRAEANPDLEEQDAQLLSQIREALPVIQQMQPVGYDGALPPTPGSVVPENAMQIVADWVYRARVGTPAEGARRDVQSLLSRIEAGRRSETEQVTQRTQRALTPEEKRQVQGTSLEGRRGVMTTEPTGQVSRAVQEDMFQDDLGTIFTDYLDFDNYLASDELDTLRTETGLVGQTVTRTAKLVAPLQSVMGKVNAELANLRAKIDTVVAERNKQATSVSAQRKDAEALLQKEKQALLAALVKADEPLAKFEASYLETALKLATATAQRESMAKAMQENAADLERRIQQYEKARGRRQEGLSALKEASRKLKATADLMLRMRTDEMTALGNILKGEVNQKKVSLLPSRDLQELNKKALAAHNEVITAMRALSPAQQLDDKVFSAFLQKEAALAAELQALTSRMYGLTGAKNRARTALINARAALDNDPQLQSKLADARASANTAALILSAARAQEQIDTNALVVPLSFEIEQLAQGVPVLQDAIKKLQSSIDTLLNPVVQRAEQRRVQSQPKKQVPTQAEKAQAEQKRLEMMQGTNFEDVVKVTFPDVKSGRTNSEAYFKLYEKAETSRAYAAFAPADKRAEAQAEAQAAQKKLDDYVNGVSKADKARMGTMSRAAKAFMARDKDRRNLRAQLNELQQRLEATREQISERTDANKPIPKALQAQLDSQLAREKEMQARLPKLQDSIKKALDAFQNASGAKAVYRSEADLFADQETDADRREAELAAIAATQTKRRVSSAATRSTSPAPTQFRTGSIESELGLGSVEVDRGVKESTKVKQRDTPVGKKELREANTLAKQIASKTDADKIAEADAAAAQAAELERITQKTLETLRVQREKAKDRAAKKTEARAKKDAESGPRLKKTRADSIFDDVYSDDLDSEFASVVRDSGYDDRPTTDLPTAVKADVRAGRLEDALLRLQDEGSTPFVRELAERIAPFLKGVTLVSNPGVVDANGVPVEALYFGNDMQVQISTATGLTEEAFLHEVVHPATLTVLKADPATLSPEQRAARQEIETLFARIQNDPKFSREYASFSVPEMVSEIMSNNKLRNMLDERGFLQRVYDAFLRLLGFTPKQVSQQAVDNIYKLFAPAQPLRNVAVASVMRGIIPDNKAKFNASVPQGIRASFGQSVQPTNFGDKMSAWALGLRVKSLDAWGAREALVKLGLSGNKLTEAQATQTRIFMRLNSETNRFVHQAMLSGPLKLSKDEKGYFGVDVDDKKPSIVKVLDSLRAAVPDIGNMKAVEELFYKHLQIKRVEEDKLGYDKINMRKPPSAQEVRELKQYIAGTPAVKAAFDKAEREYREYNNGMLDFAHSAGVFTDKEWQYFKKGSYVPFYRQTEEGNIEMLVGDSRRTIGNVIQQPQLKDLVGGEKDFLGFTESVMQNAQLLTRMSLQNLQARDVGFMVNNLGMGKMIKGEGPTNTIRFKINGENMWVKLDTDLFPKDIPAELLLQGLHGIKTAVPTALKAAGIPTQWLRSTIVRMPLYMIRQMIRDPLHAWLVTGLNFTPIVSSIKELTKIRQGLSPTEVKLMRSGAISSNVMTGDYNDAARTLRDLSDKSSFSWNSAMQSLDNFALQGDAATRAVLYDKYREQGMSHFEAALGAAEVMNFSRRGTSSSLYMISTLIPFFNAQLQGIDSVWRSGVTGDTVFEDKLQVRQKLYQRAALMMGITLAYAVAMQDDEAYKNATPQERAMNWFIPLPGADAALRVPIPFEMGAVSKAIPELLFNAAFNDADSKDTLKGLKYVLGMSIPGDIPTIAKPFVEVATNYSFFRDAPIETARDLAVSTSERYRPNTTELAKLMGQVGVSPLQVEHLVRGYFSNVGIMAMSMANPVLRPFNSDTAGEPAERRLSETPFFGAAFQPNNGRGVIESVYADVEDWQKAASTFKRLVTEGKQAEARAFADKYAREIALSSAGGSFKQTMGELAKMRRAIQADPELSATEKRARLTEIEEYQKQLAAQIRELSKQSS